jgi:uncharacterized Zn finger protein
MSWYHYSDSGARRARVEKEILKRRKRGEAFEPVVCEVRSGVPCKTFWGKAWCRNLEHYSDYENRLPRGRTYLRGGNVYDLVIGEGRVDAYVTGSEIYEVAVVIDPLKPSRWKAVKATTAGQIADLADLLAGQLGPGVLAAVTDPDKGLFPAPSEIHLACSCPDWADMCKHVAAVLYAVGVRLDAAPSLFFTLRGVDQSELLTAAAESATDLGTADPSAGILKPDELSTLFGIDLGEPEAAFGSGSG